MNPTNHICPVTNFLHYCVDNDWDWVVMCNLIDEIQLQWSRT